MSLHRLEGSRAMLPQENFLNWVLWDRLKSKKSPEKSLLYFQCSEFYIAKRWGRLHTRKLESKFSSLKNQHGHVHTDHTSVAGSLICIILEEARPLFMCLPDCFYVTAHNQITPGLCILSCELTCCFKICDSLAFQNRFSVKNEAHWQYQA